MLKKASLLFVLGFACFPLIGCTPHLILVPEGASMDDVVVIPMGGGCFTPDTQVLVSGATKAIAQVSPGDNVMVFNETSNAIDYRPVVTVFRFREDHYYLLNEDVRVTALHRFMTSEGWVRVQDLQLGMKLKTTNGWTVLKSKKRIEANVVVFNLEVEEHQNFFVAGGHESYLVHNCGGGGK